MATAVTDSGTKTPSGSQHGPIVVDLGKASRKRIRQARKGTGKLIDEVNTVVEEMRTNGTIGTSAQPIVIVVRQKRRKRKGFGFGIG